MLVDVHAHLDFEQFAIDLDKVIERSKNNGVVAIISSGVNMERNKKTLALSKKYAVVKASLGLYPTDAAKLTEKELQNEIGFIRKNRRNIVAIGEAGLDYKDGNNIPRQKIVFEEVISLAEKLKLPLIVHSRKAERDAIDMLESSRLKNIVMHCFSGKLKLVRRAEDNGWFFSIPAIIAYSRQFQSIAEMLSINQILTETDSPFLAPVKGERNEPSSVSGIVKKISEIKKLDVEETKKNIYMTYRKVFKEER